MLFFKTSWQIFRRGKQNKKTLSSKKYQGMYEFSITFQSNFLPVYEAIKQNILGELVELEVHVNTTLLGVMAFSKTLDRVEFHCLSIHYIDWIRSVLGNPDGV